MLNRDKFMPMRPYTVIHGNASMYGRFGGGLKDEYHALSNKYGGCTIPVPHPSIGAKNMWTI